MASVGLDKGKHTTGQACSGIARHNYRDSKNHSNPDIDPSRSHLNRHYGPQTSAEFRARYHAMVKEFDAKIKPKRIMKDRKTSLGMVIDSPREGMSPEQEAAWSEVAYKVIEDMFPGQVVGGTYHADEVHKYPHDGQEHISRGHTHIEVIPWHPEKGLNMDAFYKRSLPNKINAALDAACMEMFGFPYRDGSQAKSRGSVEKMKAESAEEERRHIEGQVEQARDVLDTVRFATADAQAELGHVQAELEQLQAARGNVQAALEQQEAEIRAAGDRLMEGIDGMVRAHDGLRRVLNRPFVTDRDRIEIIRDKTEMRAEKALEKPLDGIDAIMAAADAVERAKDVYATLKCAAKGDTDALDDLVADDDFGLG